MDQRIGRSRGENPNDYNIYIIGSEKPEGQWMYVRFLQLPSDNQPTVNNG